MAGKIEVAKAYVTIVPSLEGSQATITKELTGITSQASEKAGDEGGSKFGEKFGAGLKKAAAAVDAVTVATTAAAVKGISTLTTQAVKNFGDYEQLVGGVEKLFGSSADAVIANADAAFKTAGLSANEYMETVTGFSGALLRSLGNDTQAAAEMANMAISDMSDIANTYVNMAHLYEKLTDYEKIEACLDRAKDALETDPNRNGYYAYTCRKCAPSFGYFGYFLYEKELNERADSIYAGA